jgi:uncharacterized protein (TIGR02001 family)
MTQLKKLAAACSAVLAMTALEAGAATGQGMPVTQINVYDGKAVEAPPAAEPAAEEKGDHTLAANIALVSNYVFRGYSQTDKGPAVQGGFDYTYNPLNLYLGTWASNVSSDGYYSASMELDVYGGWRPTFFEKLTLDLGVLGYLYPGNDSETVTGSGVNTVEYKLGASYDFGVVTPGFTVFYSPDWFTTEKDAWRYELSASVPLPMEFKLVGKYGWNRFESGSVQPDYEDWSIGVTKDVLGVTLGLAYTDTQSLNTKTDCPAPFQCDGQVIVSISKVF